MSRAARIAGWLVTAFSAPVLAATIVLWARSTSITEEFWLKLGRGTMQDAPGAWVAVISANRGVLIFELAFMTGSRERFHRRVHVAAPAVPEDAFNFESIPGYFVVNTPCWFAVVLWAALPLWRAWRWVAPADRRTGRRGFDVLPQATPPGRCGQR